MAIRDLIPWNRGVPTPATGREDPIQALQSEVNRVFDAFWRGLEGPSPGRPESAPSLPRLDLRENGKEVEVIAELPGVKEGAVEVAAVEGALVIRAESVSEREDGGKGYTVRERSIGRLERAVTFQSTSRMSSPCWYSR